MMKIAFSGASGTGKTSVARELLQTPFAEAQGLLLVGVDSRALLTTLGLGLANKISSTQYRVFQTMYISRKIVAESIDDSFVTERSFADCLAYWRIHCAQSATTEENELIERICRDRISQYDVHFLFPVGYLKLEEDGFRHTQIDYHAKYQAVLQGILTDFGISPLTMPRASVNERVRFLVQAFNV